MFIKSHSQIVQRERTLQLLRVGDPGFLVWAHQAYILQRTQTPKAMKSRSEGKGITKTKLVVYSYSLHPITSQTTTTKGNSQIAKTENVKFIWRFQINHFVLNSL